MFARLRKLFESRSSRRKKGVRERVRRLASRRPVVEPLESRNLMAGLPFGVQTNDTGEYMLGDIYVTVVLMESDPTLSPNDPSTENWTPTLIQEAKTKVQDALHWWQDTLANKFPGNTMPLNFVVDFTYADAPIRTGYEPINQHSQVFKSWIYDFLNTVSYNQTLDFSRDIHAFNHHQRTVHNTDWAFTILMVNSTNDLDESFASGGEFPRAFSYPGGQFMVVPSGRPTSTIAHETAHLFWGRDEYPGASSQLEKRGYYNTANLNAADGAPIGFVQQDSIMSNGTSLLNAFANHTSAPSTLAMIGWKDSDNDGIFDVLDVPFSLSGTGYFDSSSGTYKFQGKAAVQTLPNRNSSGLQSDITISEISRAQYRIDGGAWQTAATYHTHSANLNLSFAVPTGSHSVDIRVIDDVIGNPDGNFGSSAPMFQGTTDRATSLAATGVMNGSGTSISGFVFRDTDNNNTLGQNEKGMAGWTVQLVNGSDQPVTLSQTVEPDAFTAGTIVTSAYPGVTLSAQGGLTDGTVLIGTSSKASTGARVFQSTLDFTNDVTWNHAGRNLRIQFATPTTTLSIDAIGDSANSYGQLEIYDATNTLLARYTTNPLAAGAKETMTLNRPTADIAYAIARGRNGSAVQLDNLRFGASNSATTDTLGAYVLPALPAGTYTVKATAPSGWIPNGNAAPNQTATLNVGQSASSVNFAQHGELASWQNPTNHLDVNKDTFVAPNDALIIINELNSVGSHTLAPLNGAIPTYYFDVDGDGVVAPIDALLVINHLNSDSSGESPLAPSSNTTESVTSPVPHNEHIVVLTKTERLSLQPVAEGEQIATGFLPLRRRFSLTASARNIFQAIRVNPVARRVIAEKWPQIEKAVQSIAADVARARLLEAEAEEPHTHHDH